MKINFFNELIIIIRIFLKINDYLNNYKKRRDIYKYFYLTMKFVCIKFLKKL